jgi:alpha-1,2-mannosyltransferase
MTPVTGRLKSSSADAPAYRGGSRARYWVLAVLLVVLASAPEVYRYLVSWPQDQWQVDVQVYREAGVSAMIGRPIYAALTEAPQLLPFTYPPFAALLAIPLALIPFGVVGWLWTYLQIVATTGIVWYAGWRLIHRAGPRVPLVLAVLTIPMLYLEPVSDGLRFGQVNAFLVLACLMDLRRPRPRVLRWLPPGVLVGLSTAVKLTPGVFIVHYLLNRRWREAAWAVGSAVAATVGMFFLLPQASFAFWGGALQDPNRLGPNDGTSNQSIRGVLLRHGPAGVGGDALWIVLIAVVAVVGFGLGRRAYRMDDSISEVAAMGLMAVLLSPVAWIHHLHWVVVVIAAILGADPLRDRRRLVAAAVIVAWFWTRMPWWGHDWLVAHRPVRVLGLFMENGFTIAALTALAMLWWVLHTRPTVPDSEMEIQAHDLKQRQHGEQQADDAAGPADGAQADAAQQHAPEHRAER